jgi:hypothetical protein
LVASQEIIKVFVDYGKAVKEGNIFHRRKFLLKLHLSEPRQEMKNEKNDSQIEKQIIARKFQRPKILLKAVSKTALYALRHDKA